MTSTIARRQTPEERELERKKAELAALEAELAQRELELATLQGELHAFERCYGRQGRRSESLDALDSLRKLDPSLAAKLADFLSTQ